MLKKWGGDHKSILKDVPAIKMTDNGIRLAGSADISGHQLTDSQVASSAELQALAKAENPVNRAQLEDLSEELTQEAVEQLEVTKE